MNYNDSYYVTKNHIFVSYSNVLVYLPFVNLQNIFDTCSQDIQLSNSL